MPTSDLVQGSSGVMGAEPGNATNTNYFQCNYTDSNPAAPWALMVAWRPVVDTREISKWYTCRGITSFYLEFSFGTALTILKCMWWTTKMVEQIC